MVPPETVAVTVTVAAAAASSATEVGFTDSARPVGAASSSVMVPTASSSLTAAPLAPVSLTRKVSSGSSTLSSAVATVKVEVVSPASMVRVRAVATAV